MLQDYRLPGLWNQVKVTLGPGHSSSAVEIAAH